MMRYFHISKFPPTLGFLVFLMVPITGVQIRAQGREAQSRQIVEPSPASIPVEVSSSKLVEEADKWNGLKVIFTGEAIGESMVRGEKAWIHLNDDVYMWKNIEEGAKLGGYNSGHAIWIDAGLAQKITFYGDYLHEGDIVKVTGTFHSVCREHGGDMDIHADTLEIFRIGHRIGHVINFTRALLGSVLLMIAGILFWVRKKAILRRT
jgi:hypothetical protein